MPARRKRLYEPRTRVIAHLPVNDPQQEKAFFQIIRYVREQREEDIGLGGYTHSVLRPAAFSGWWWSDERGEWVPDDIVLCIVDYHLSFNDPRLSKKVQELKQTIRTWYRYYRRPQEEAWVVAHPVLRQD